jgi:hypothetical protein
MENVRRGGARTHFLRRDGIPGTPRNGGTPRVRRTFAWGLGAGSRVRILDEAFKTQRLEF